MQTYHPTLLLENAGRTTRVETHKINGEVDVSADSMTLQINAANNPALQIKIEDGRGYGRLGEADEWTEVELATELFAPGNDPMGFLAAAENIQLADGSRADGIFPTELLPVSLTRNITRYQFDVSGPKYAIAIRDQLEEQLIRRGELPHGITLQLAQNYVDMTGRGEIWVYKSADGRELPMRQIVQLDFPAQTGASEWVSAEITTTYSDWSQPAGEVAFDSWFQDPLGTAQTLAASIFGNLSAETVRQVGVNSGLLLILLAGGGLLLAYGRRQEVRVAFNLTLVVSMLASPLLQAQQAHAQSEQINAFNERQLARQAELTQAQETAASSVTTLPATMPSFAPALSSSCVITATSDCDGDGLTDNVERYQIGTNIEKVDTDGDGISDGREVASFEWFGTWTLDPLNPDSNGDGLDDGAECYTRSDTSNGVLVDIDPEYPDIPCLDRDADEVPDVYDFDNDGDGVPDSIDLNPNASQVVTDNSVFKLDLVNAQTAQNIIVDLQIRPLNDQHLWWTNSILDWPDADNRGQHQRMTPNTLGNGDGDIQLMPMLEVTIPYSPTNPSGGLPVSGTPTITATTPISTWLDTAVTNQYAMTVRLGPNGERIANLPLIEITDPTGGGPVGWQARIPYRLQTAVSDWGNPHEMRVVWFVNGQQDSCTPPANAPTNYCDNSANWTSVTTLLQTYPDTFRITGLSVSEHHGATALLAGQTPGSGNANYQNELWHLADVMQKTWLLGDTVSSQRFPLSDVDSSLGAWGLTNIQTSESSGLMDEVALLNAVDLTAVTTFINSLYTSAPISGTTTTVLMAGEQSYRTVYLGTIEEVDINSTPTVITRTVYANSVMTVDLTAKAVAIDGMLRWQPYQFNGTTWEPADLGTTVDQLGTSLKTVFTDATLASYQLINATTPASQYDPAYDLERQGAALLGQNFYLAMSAGVNAPLLNPTPTDIVLTDYPLPAETAAAIVQAMTTKVKDAFTLLNLNGQDFPTVDSAVDTQGTAAWQGLASSIAAVTKAYGQLASGTNSSALSQALTELTYLPRISIEQDTFDYLTDGALIFAAENGRVQSSGLSGTFKTVLATTYPLASGAMATYGHLWFANEAVMTEVRAGVLLNPNIRSSLSSIENQRIRMIAINDQMVSIQSEIDDLIAQGQLQLSQMSANNLAYNQKARSVVNYYIKDHDPAVQQAAKAMGFSDDAVNVLPPSLVTKYSELQTQLVDLDGKMTQTINRLDGSEAYFKKSYNLNPDDLSPTHALKAQRVAKAWGAVGVLTSVATAGLTIGLALANGRFQTDSPQFSRFLAEQIAGVIVDVFLAVLDVLIVLSSIPILGLFLAFIAVLDAVVGAVCAATNFSEKEPTIAYWVCGGISGALAKGLAYVINDTTPLVNLDREDRIAVNLDAPAIGNETGIYGLIVGNSITISGSVTTTLYMNDPNWMGYIYAWQWTDQYLDDATFAYKFQAAKEDLPLDLNGTIWNDVPGKVSSSISANDARFRQQLPITPYVYTFPQPGINTGLPLYLAEGFAMQQQNCWVFGCVLSEYDDTINQPMENTFIFDVWPGSIDDLRALTLQPANDGRNGYRLAWDATFPTLADADGDGLRSQALNGPDPDDSNPDSDGDGLPDSYEVATAGFDPTKGDSDCDGLTDYWEAFYGTNPARKDSDGDGLTDNEEHFHPNQIYPYDTSVVENLNPPLCSVEKTVYTGGWSVVYDYDSSGNPLLVRVSADPLDPDSDDDGLTDKQERIYAYNPNVASTLNVLSLNATIQSDNSQLPFVSPGSVLSYTAVVTNELTLPYARGLVETELPLDNVLRFQSTEAIAPQTAVTINGNVGLTEAGLSTTGPVNMAIRAGAKIDDPTDRVLWLHLNDNSGSTTFADASFRQNDGSCSGASCPVADNQQLTFDGNDAIVVPDGADLDLSQFTLALSLKPTTASQFGTLISKGADFYVNQNYFLAYNNGRITFVASNSCGASNGVVEGPPVPLNAWSHVTATYDGSGMALYINGKLVGSQAYSGALCNNNQPVLVGALKADGSGTQNFIGQIDEVEIYPTALDAGTILDRYATPVLQVNMRDGSTWGSDDVSCSGAACPAVGNGGATFNQVNNLVATAPDLSGDAFAFATWIRPQTRTYPFSNASATAHGKWTDADYQGVFGYQPTTTSKTIFPSLFVGSNGRLRMIWGDGTTTCEVASANTGVVAVNSTWQHLAVSYDGSTLTFYVNGAPISGGTTGSCAAVTPPTVSNFYIGRPNDFGYLYFNQMAFTNLNDAAGIGQKAEMRLNFDSDASSGNLAWSNLNKGTSSWSLGVTAVVNDTNSWFRVWDNRDGGCFFTCPEDESSDTNYDQDSGKKDTSITQITGINSTSYLGERSNPVSMPACGSLCLPAIIGSMSWSNYNDFFKGTLDDFRVYGYPLTPAAVADIFRSTSTALDLTFDEAPGSSLFADQSGNAVTVSCTGDTCPTSGVPGRFNQALNFDGVDDYLTISASSTALGTSTGSFSAMMWIKPDSLRGTGDYGDTPLLEIGSYDLALLNYGRPGVFGYRWTDNFTLYNNVGRWYHLAYVFENGIYTFYVNGENKGSTAYGLPGAKNSLRIGTNGSLYFDGLMDDLTVVRRALTATEVQAHFKRVPAVNLHLDEGLKTNNGVVANQGIRSFVDDSESRYVATCTSVDTCPDAGDKGQVREAITFDGNDTLTMAQTNNLALTDFSVGMWVKPTQTTTTRQRLITKSNSNFLDTNFELRLVENSLNVVFERQYNCLSSENRHAVTAGTPLLENQWNHVMATHDATHQQMRIYINGALAGTTNTGVGTICTIANPIRLGMGYTGGMDEVIVTPSVLSADAVAALYDYQAAWYDVISQHALYIDADLPTVDLSKTAVILNAEQTVLYIGADDATSPVTKVEYRINGGSWQEAAAANNQAANSGAWLFYFQQNSGTYTLEARATDAGGNESAIASTTIVVDTQAPTVTISNSSAVVQAIDSTPLSGTAVDTNSGVPTNGVTVRTLDWQNEQVGGNLFATLDGSGSWQVDLPFETVPYGSYTVVATAQDEVGNSTTTTQTINLDGLPPYADVTRSDNYFVTTNGETITGVAGESPYPADSRTLHLHFEDGTGLWVDGSKTQFEMQCVNTACPTSGVAGQRGTAITFDGVDDVLHFGGNEAVTTTVTAGQLGLLDGSFTVMAWVQADDWTGSFPILGSSPATPGDGLLIGLENGRPTLGYGGDDTTLTDAIPTGEWAHLAWRFDAVPGERTFFVNGVAVGTPSAGHTPLSAEDDIELGRARGSSYYGGALDELVVYGSALDAETIYDIVHPVSSTVSEMSLRIRSYAQRDIGQYGGTWNPVTLDTSNALYTTWQYALPTLAQDSYKIDLLVTDSSGNSSFVEGAWDLAVIQPNVSVAKHTSATLVELGDDVTFTIPYTNTSLAPVTGVTLNEVVPVDSSFNAGLSDAGWICTPDGSAGNACTLSVGALAAGESGSATFVVTAASAWSAGTTTISNTVTIDVDGEDDAPADNIGTAEVPINGGVDLAVSIASDGNSLYYDDSQPTPVYTITYSNLSTDQTAVAELVEPLPPGVQSNFTNYLTGWRCDSIYTGGTCTYQLGEVAPGESGTITFTFASSFTPPPTNVVTNTVSIRDISGVTDFNPANDEASVTTPFVLDFDIVPSQEAVIVNEGATAVLTGTVVDSSGAWSMLFPGPSIGTITQDEINLTWTWTYTTTDGPDESQLVDLVGIFNEGGVVITHTFPLTVVNVLPTVPITGTDQVAVGVSYNLELGTVFDPGPDTVTACSLDWGDETTSDCLAFLGGGSLGHVYGNGRLQPIITVNLTDEDGTHVAASKQLTITGITPSLNVDQATVGGDESQIVTNTGTYTPPDASFSWSASEGTIVDEGNGVWSWNLPAGSAEGSRTITIHADASNTTFTVNVVGDGAASNLEDGAPNSGDGNNDGTPDKAQMHVASLPSPITGQYVTLAASPGMTLTNVSFPATPTSGVGSLPADVTFPLGFPTFNLSGMGAGGSAEVTMYLTSTTGINTYYKYDATNGWYEFAYDSNTDTGAEFVGNTIALYFVDGARGDNDLSANGIITDPGGPAFKLVTYDLTVSTTGGGSVSVPSGSYPAGTVLNLQAIEDVGWGFSGWQGALSGTQISQTLTMDQDRSITAVFAPLAYTLDVAVVGNGSVGQTPLQPTYAYNDLVALNAVAETGWSFSGWSGDVTGSNATKNVTINSNKVITATFTQDSYTVTTHVSGNGSVVVSPDQAGYVYGDVVSVLAVPDPGYTLQSWSGDLSGDGAGQSLTMDGDKSVTAIFATATYTVETSVIGSGTVLVDPLQSSYSYGDVISVTAVPAADWAFSHWMLGLSGITATQALTVTGNTNLQAVFEPITYGLNVGWTGDGTVAILPDKTEFTAGEVVTVTATSGVGHTFTGWREQQGETLFSTSITTTVTMTEEKSILAVFTPITYTLDVNLVGSGSVAIGLVDVTCVANCSQEVSYGSVISMTAVADSGATFTGWSGAVSGTQDTVTVTVTANTQVTAVFTTSDTRTLTVTTDGTGSGSVTSNPAGIACTSGGGDCTEAFDPGTVVTLSAVAASGSIFDGWGGDCSGTDNCVVTMDTAQAVTATFATAPIASISKNGSDVVLNWVHTVPSGSYEVWYSPVPYFAISDPEAVKLSDIQGTTEGETLAFTHVGVAANSNSYFYLIRVTNGSGEVFSNHVGKVGFDIQPGQ
ncbi:MAG: LamG-like jellyroll fold domain-containing protein [Chloroflexota bacterium]